MYLVVMGPIHRRSFSKFEAYGCCSISLVRHDPFKNCLSIGIKLDNEEWEGKREGGDINGVNNYMLLFPNLIISSILMLKKSDEKVL